METIQFAFSKRRRLTTLFNFHCIVSSLLGGVALLYPAAFGVFFAYVCFQVLLEIGHSSLWLSIGVFPCQCLDTDTILELLMICI